MTSSTFAKKQQANFRIIDDLKSDISFEGYGKDLNEMFCSCALALSSISYDVNMVPKTKKVRFSLRGKPEPLLYDFLSKILFLIETKEMFFSKFNVELILKRLDSKVRLPPEDASDALKCEYSLNCECLGASIADISKTTSKVHIKAITLHNLKISKNESKAGYISHVSLDV
jgi:SHS2 domain-containing protein